MKRLQSIDIQALMDLRSSVIRDHETLLDGASSPHTAMVKQSVVAASFQRTISALEEILHEAGGVEFSKTR
jgi:hypothetical protein